MFRAALLLAGFVIISPGLRSQLFNAADAINSLIAKHSTISLVAAGVLCFSSFLLVQFQSRK